MSAASNTIRKVIANIDPNIIVTTSLISDKYGEVIDIDGLATLLKVKRNTIQKQISDETFPIPVTKVGASWIATPYNVACYLSQNEKRFAA